MDQKIKELNLKPFQNIDLYKNEYNSVGSLVVSNKGKTHSISFFREPYTNDMAAVVLPYRRTTNGQIKVLYQKRIIPFWNGTSDEMDIAIFSPCTEKNKPMIDLVAAEIERKTGYDVKDSLEFRGAINVYPKLATKVYMFLTDITHKVRVHDPIVHIEEVELNDEHFKASEPFLQLLMETLKKETKVEVKQEQTPTFNERYDTHIKAAFYSVTGLCGTLSVLGVAELIKRIFS